MEDLPNEALGRIISFAVCSNNQGGSLYSFELVCPRWKVIMRGEGVKSVWELACQQKFFPGSEACSRDEYLFLHTPVAQSAARVIQRAMYRDKIITGYAPYQIREQLNSCCICGVRWSLVWQRCYVSSCPFRSRFFACGPCGHRFQDKAMGSFNCSHLKGSLVACFKCSGECDGSMCSSVESSDWYAEG